MTNIRFNIIKNNYIETLVGLRGLLFIFIMIHHVYLASTNFVINNFGLDSIFQQLGNFAVTFFFIISGFSIALGYSNKFSEFNINIIFSFLKKRFVKIYPLYLFTGIICLIYLIINFGHSKLSAFVVYVLMLQSWTTHITSGGNGAAWFISSIFFCYFLTPIFLYLKNKSMLKNMFLYIVFFIMLIFLSVYLYMQQVHSSIYGYLYHFPLLRIIHYFMGLLLGDFYINNKKIFSKFHIKTVYKISGLEILYLFSLFYIIYLFKGNDSLIFFKTQLMYVPLISFLIIYFANIKKGLFYKILTETFLIHIGTISLSTYLIHYVFITIFSKYFLFITTFATFILANFIILGLTLLSSVSYENLIKIIVIKTKKEVTCVDD